MNDPQPTPRNFEPTWASLDQRPIPSWFGQAKFGIFIHWGVYSVPAWRRVEEGRYASYAEWYYARVMFNEENGGKQFHQRVFGADVEYRDFAPLFRAELFDPGEWAALFARSGAKYVVLTSKHHDGYCLWPAKSSCKKGWNSQDSGPRRDLVGELTSAVRAQGLRMGLYYSIIEWESNRTHRTESGYFLPERLVQEHGIPEEEYVDRLLLPQLRELVEAYQPAVIFADGGEWDRTASEWKTLDFLAWLYNHAPNRAEVVVNDRFGKDMPGQHGDYFSSEYEDTDAVGAAHPWEESRGIGGSYGFNRAEDIDDYASTAELVGELVDVVSRGGNLLLNIGPTADGRIPLIMQQRLVEIGAWLSVNGEAIYGTHPWELAGQNHGGDASRFFTRKGQDLYVICTRWPLQALELRGVEFSTNIQVRLLGSEHAVTSSVRDDRLVIEPPAVNPATMPCQHAWVFRVREFERRE